MLTILLLYVSPLILTYYILKTYLTLSSIPGPILNKLTNIPRLLSVYRRNPHNEQLTLHNQYGDLVRLGPNMISISGPEYIPQIYGIGKGMVKSGFYEVFQNVVNGKRAASLVAMTDESVHARTKRSIAGAYSLSTLVEFEGLVDRTTEVFLDVLDERFASAVDENKNKKAKSFDLGRWLQYYAFDVIGELTFSKRLGFIEGGEDVGGIIESIGRNFDYFSVLGQMPWLDEAFLGKNPLYIRFFAKPVASPILKFAQGLLQERLDQEEEKKKGVVGDGDGKDQSSNGSDNGVGKPDFLTRFLKIRNEDADAAGVMSDRQLLSYLFMNINAGSDTIASTLRATIYYLLKNPSSLDKLTSELETAYKEGNLTLPCPTWHETQSEHLPYLRAVVKEGIRMNPALSLPLERVVPKEGIVLHHPSSSSSSSPTKPTSTHLPGGTIIGINPYVLHRDPRIFSSKSSPDPNKWDPSRWLPSPSLDRSSSPNHDENEAERIKLMDSNILSFGAGKRTCMGKNIAMMELHKIVPALVMRFDIRLDYEGDDDDDGWRVRNSWVLNHEGLVVRIKRRAKKKEGRD